MLGIWAVPIGEMGPCLNLHLPDDICCGTSFHMRICHLIYS